MWRNLICIGIVLATCPGEVSAADSPVKGRVKRVDRDRKTLAVTIDGRDRTLKVTTTTSFVDARTGRKIPAGIDSILLREGVEVTVTIVKMAKVGEVAREVKI